MICAYTFMVTINKICFVNAWTLLFVLNPSEKTGKLSHEISWRCERNRRGKQYMYAPSGMFSFLSAVTIKIFKKIGKISHKEISKDITLTMDYDKTEERHNEAEVS